MRLHKPKTIIFIALIFLAVPFLLGYLRNANATNSAFPNSKHGGGTVDGIPFTGVDRGLNPDYGTYYNNIGTEAGQYKPGECTHCHEPHASFGGSEPFPDTAPADSGGGPNQYLGMADASPDFCWYCHESINFDPFYGGGTGFWQFYQGQARYQASGHYNNTNMKNPGYGAGSIWPRTNRTSNLQAGHCLNCHTPHGIMEPSATPYDTTAVPTAGTNKHLAANNPSVSANYLIPRQLIAWEEALCENCHKAVAEGGIAAAKDIKTQISKLEGTGSGHPLHNVNQTGSGAGTTFSGRHSLKNEANPTVGSWNSYAANTRHVECYDCHNPHVAKTGTSGPNLFRRSGESSTGRDVTIGPVQVLTPDGYGGANSGVWGVNVNTSSGLITTRASEATYLYQVCLKCHSAYADSTLTTQQGYSGPEAPSWTNRSRWDGQSITYLGGDDTMYLTDVATDFATDNITRVGSAPPKGYHPVFALGRNQPAINANPRWGVTTYSSRPTGVINTAWGFRNNFVPPWGPAAYVTCVDCHEDSSDTTPRGPHGSDRPFILRKLDPTITYTILNDGSGSSRLVNYSSFAYGYVSNTQHSSYGPVNLGTTDPNNLCLNCHRADVYGFHGQATGGPTCPQSHNDTENVWPRYRGLARQPHPVDGEPGKGHSFCDTCAHASTGDAPRGIVCMRCHGGGSVGGIHGNLGNINGHDNGTGSPGSSPSTQYRYDTSITNVPPSSNRLLNGLAWEGVRYGATNSLGGCYKGNESLPFNLNGCTHSGGGDIFGINATYDY